MAGVEVYTAPGMRTSDWLLSSILMCVYRTRTIFAFCFVLESCKYQAGKIERLYACFVQQKKLYRLCKIRQLIKFHRSVHLHPASFTRPSFPIFRGSGSKTSYPAALYLLLLVSTISLSINLLPSGFPRANYLRYDSQSRTLTCSSYGGPATTVTWKKDGALITPNATYQLTKRVVDPVQGIYQVALTIDSSVCQSDIAGIYYCTVDNARGRSSRIAVISGNGELIPICILTLFNPVHKRFLLYQRPCFQPTHSTN